MNPLIVIPARMASTRLPGKMMADIGGKPMIQRVYERCAAARVAPVLVACDSPEIKALIESLGGQAVLTDPDLPSGSDRVWAGVELYDPKRTFDVIINVQGDLPFLEPLLLACVMRPLANSAVDIATVATRITDPNEKDSPHVVKIALCGESHQDVRRALYFSRAPIPFDAQEFYHHIGIYAYRRKKLGRFVNLKPSFLEKCERLEQLRALEEGMRIDVSLVQTYPLSVDCAQDLDKARERLRLSFLTKGD